MASGLADDALEVFSSAGTCEYPGNVSYRVCKGCLGRSLAYVNFRRLTYHSSIINSYTARIPLTYAVTTQKPTILQRANKIPIPIISDTISYTNFD